MLVSQVLRSKADDGVLTIRPGAPVAEAARVMSERRVGSLVVSVDGRHAVGIVSERDVVREIGRTGAACLTEPVSRFMTADIVTCRRGDRADDVLAIMTTGRFRHLPVVEDDELVGLVSIGDVVKARLNELATERDALEGMIKGF
jgi:CBS domain-containing protein